MMYHSPSNVFMTNKDHIGTKSIAKASNQTEIAKWPKPVFFLLQAG